MVDSFSTADALLPASPPERLALDRALGRTGSWTCRRRGPAGAPPKRHLTTKLRTLPLEPLVLEAQVLDLPGGGEGRDLAFEVRNACLRSCVIPTACRSPYSHPADPDKDVDDRLGGEGVHGSAPDVLHRQDVGTDGRQNARALLRNIGGQRGS